MKTYAVEVVKKVRMVVYYKADSADAAMLRAQTEPTICEVVAVKEDEPREMMNFKPQEIGTRIDP